MYYSMGNDIKAGKKAKSTLQNKSGAELKEMRDRIMREAEDATALMQHKYGAING